jgi:hypothetical protein
MDPETTLQIMRETVKQFQRIYDDSSQGEHATNSGADNALIDLGDTMAEAFSALDEWLSRGGLKPEDWNATRVNQRLLKGS